MLPLRMPATSAWKKFSTKACMASGVRRRWLPYAPSPILPRFAREGAERWRFASSQSSSRRPAGIDRQRRAVDVAPRIAAQKCDERCYVACFHELARRLFAGEELLDSRVMRNAIAGHDRVHAFFDRRRGR